ncbi:hypothetical protein GCM10010394_03560 [Streptomyces crystallinus]|uniref:Uncharacterized protein n=1 Tax=Streptomyces crystallinus TaxID=68191 RepID=A0ABP3Q252_9ACTN
MAAKACGLGLAEEEFEGGAQVVAAEGAQPAGALPGEFPGQLEELAAQLEGPGAAERLQALGAGRVDPGGAGGG